ncbi:MAG: hypothetical protein EOL95_01410 [Bacteroidia bacterium]|nr:hypothetical protein [Bacteroidia bacterium]
MKLKYIILLAIVAIAYIAYKRKQKEKAAVVETEKIQHGFKYGELEPPKKTDSKDDELYTYEKYIEDVIKNPSQYTWAGPVTI